MKRFLTTATATVLMLSAPAIAATDADDSADTAMAAPSGDAAAGEKAFGRQCVTCHVVKSDDGELLAGRRGRQGPNLYGVVGGPVGAVDGFKYSKGMSDASETEEMWTEDNFVTYVQDPTDWLRETTGDERARSRMAWKVREPQDAKDIYAFLHKIAPHEDE